MHSENRCLYNGRLQIYIEANVSKDENVDEAMQDDTERERQD